MKNAIITSLTLAYVLASVSTQAATVTTLTDAGPGSLRQAIANATPGETIGFAVTGTIVLTSGELLINKDLVISGPGAANLVVQRSSASGTLNFRIFHVQSGIVQISGLTITNGHTDAGGGIENEFAFLTLHDCIISGNSATVSGGGIENRQTLNMTNCVISANSVSGGPNGGFGGGINNVVTLTNVDCLIVSNSVSGGAGNALGGGINNSNTVTLINSVVAGNSATAGPGAQGVGGGIYNENSLQLYSSTVSGNSVTGGSGGSPALGEGGGIASLGAVTLVQSTVSGNIASGGAGGPALGGGLINDSGQVDVTNSTVSGNLATGGNGTGGGGLANTDGGAALLYNSTIVSNIVSGGPGSGFFTTAGGALHFQNTILAANSPAPDLFAAVPDDIFSEGFNVIGSTNVAITLGPRDQVNVTAAELKLGPLQNNGGPTLTHALLCGSVAIDAGDNTNAPPTDQRGFARIVNGIIDIGSFESSNGPPPSCTIDGPSPVCPQSTNTYTSTASSGASHSWSITGNGTILSSLTASSVSVAAGGIGVFVLSDTVAFNGCTDICVKMVSVQDTNTPTINCAPNKTNECAVGTLDFDTPTATDNCGPVTIAILGTVTNFTCGNTFVATRTWLATDASGNTNTCSQTIALIDTNPPSITCPTNLTVSCVGQVPAPDTNSVTTSDNCGGAVSVTWQGDSISSSNCPGQFVISRTYRATDQCGNSASCTQTITVHDTTPPSLTCPTNLTVTCAGQVPEPNTNSVTTSDNCGGAVSVTWQGDSISSSNCPGQFVITRTYRAADQCGNSATCTQTITVQDTTPPSITCPTNLTVSCAGQVPEPNTNSVNTSDNCGGAVSVTWQGDSISSSNCPGQFVITRTYRATDQCGNSASCTQTITVHDTTPPSITCPTNLTVSCAGQVPEPETNDVTTSDNCGGAVTVTWQGDTIGSSNCPGQFVITRTYRATDQCGNSATCTQTITVNDTTPPSITCPTNLTVSCAGQVPEPNTNSVSTSDNCGGAVTVTWQGDTIGSSNCPGQFVITRTYRAADQCGNAATCTQTITVHDTTPPSITCPTNLTVSCVGQVPEPNTNSVTTSDNCGGVVTVAWQGDSISSSNCPGQFVITRTYRAADQCGNSATCTQTITVNDTTPPTITCPTNLTVSCAGQVPEPNTNSVTTSDNCGGAVSVTWQGDSITSSNCPGQFVITRTYRATDQCGNSATCTQTITVHDTTPPSITCPTNLTVSCAGQVPEPNTNSVTTSDNCGGAVIVTWQGDTTGASNCPGQFVITRTYRAVDQCGNSATCTQTITVHDTTPPSISCPTNLTVSCAGQVPAPDTNSVSTSDNCGGAATVTWQGDTIGASNCPGQFVITRTYRATDQCGNSASCTQTITVHDTTPPSITCPTNLTVSCAGQVPEPNTNSVITSDNCGGAVTVTWQGDSISSSNCPGRFVITRTYRAADQCGNTATCAQIITVNDTTAPVITCSANKTNQCGLGNLTFDTPAATDNCGPVTIQILSTVTNSIQGQTIVVTRTWVATDSCGNTSSCSQTISTVETTTLTITCPAPIVLQCASPTGAVGTVSVTVADVNSEPLVVVWTVDGIAIQTNLVPAGRPSTTATVDLTAAFGVGSHQVTASVSSPGGCQASCSTSVTALGIGDLYPIALNVKTLAGVPVGGVLSNIFNGIGSGNFGWLTWAGSPSEPTLVTSLTPPGNSRTYINPNNPADHVVSIGDWVQGKTGLTNSRQVRNALNTLEHIDITVPVWDKATGHGNNSLYHVVGFARVRLISYQLARQNRITARFLGRVDCN